MSPVSLASFIEELGKCRVLEPGQLDEVSRLQSRFADARGLARELLGRGWISAYQANLILTDRGQELVLGSYVLMQRIGEGGMGQVFKARNWKLGKIVAVKVIRQDRLTSSIAVRRFEREIRAASRLHHVNIVQTIDADQVQDTHLLVMELVEGGRDLNQVVKEDGPLPVRLACECIRQAALGLQHASERGMVHRDIKPHNLLLLSGAATTPDSPLTSHQIKILDMGLARVHDEEEDDKSSQLTMENTVMGTPDFIAPEQAIDPHRADIRADLYSLGCVFFYLLTGRPPFGGNSLTDKLLKHQTEPPPHVAELRPEVPEAIGRVIHKLLAKRPVDRYQTPAELANVLQAFLNGEPVHVNLADAPSATLPVPAIPSGDPFADLRSDELTDQTVPQTPSTGATRPAKIFWLAGGAAACLIALVVIVVLRGKGEPAPPPPAGKIKAVVEAGNRWQDTGIDLEADTTITVTVQGKIKKKDWPESSGAGLESRQRDRTILFHVPPLCLLGRIGEQEPFPVGNASTIKPKEPGRLFVQINDLDLRDVSGRLTLELNPARQGAPAAKRPAPVRIQAAEAALENLAANLARSQHNLDERIKHVQDFQEKYQGLPAAARAKMLWHIHLAGLPSPLDSLDTYNVPAKSRELWGELDQPKELVAVLGKQGAWPAKSLAISPDNHSLLRSIEEQAGYWDLLSGKELPAFAADKKMTALALSPKMDLAVAATQAGDLPLWNPQTGKAVGKLSGHKAAATSVMFSFDGAQVLSGSQDGTVRLWDVAARKELRRWEGFRGAVLAAALSPDGRVLAAAGQDLTLRFWNPALAEEPSIVVKGYAVPVSALSFSPDGWTLAAAHQNGHIKFWDLSEIEPKERSAGVAIVGKMPVLAYSPDGHWLLAGSQTGALTLWEATTTKKLWEWKLPGPIASLAFATDSRHAALGMGNGVVFLFRLGMTAPPAPESAEAAYQNLLTRAAEPGADVDKLLRDVARFRARFAGMPQANKAAEFFWKFPSPLDRLEAANFPDNERAAWQPKELVAILGSQRLRHATGVTQVALSPDGKTLATASLTGAIVLWDAVTGKELKRLGNHTGDVLGLAFHKDGQLFASAAKDGVKLWNVITGKIVRTVIGILPATVAFSPDGTLLAVSLGDTVDLRDIKSWTIKQTLRSQRIEVQSLAFSPEGDKLASGGKDGGIRLWDLRQPGLVNVFAQKEGPVVSLAFHPEKKLLASAANTVKLWDMTTNKAVKTWPGGHALAFDKTGNLLAFASGNSIKLWDAAGAKLSELKGHIRAVRSIALDSEGKLLASGSDDTTARLWDATGAKETLPIRSFNGWPLAFSPDGRTLFCSGQQFHGPQSWDLTSQPLKARTFQPQPYGVHGLAVSPDGWTLATGNYAGDSRLLLWDVARPGQYLVVLGHKAGIAQTAFSPDGRKVASCSTDNTVRFWDPFTAHPFGAPLLGHSLGITCLAYSPDGRWLATGSNDATARLWDLRTGNNVHTFTEHGKGAVRAVAFSRSGALLASVGLDQKIHVHEVAKRELRYSLAAPPGSLYWVLAVSPDDKMLATSSDKGGIYVWDLATGKKLREWQFPFLVHQVAFAPDARHLAVAGGNGAVYLLRLKDQPSLPP